jgi:hypothetical protein
MQMKMVVTKIGSSAPEKQPRIPTAPFSGGKSGRAGKIDPSVAPALKFRGNRRKAEK